MAETTAKQADPAEVENVREQMAEVLFEHWQRDARVKDLKVWSECTTGMQGVFRGKADAVIRAGLSILGPIQLDD